MEKQISDVKELDENEIASMIYEKVDAFWGKFPNLWYYVTKDDIVSLSVLDLYKPRKADNVPHIVHYYNTKGERSLKPLIGLVTYNVMVHEARFIHSTGIYNNEARRNVRSPMSLNVPIEEDSDVTLEDIIKSNDNIPKEIDYIMLVDSLPNKLINNVYYKVDNKYIVLSYKTLLNDILNGYNMSQISDKLFKLNKQGEYIKFRDLSNVVKEMKSEIKEFLKEEYNYTEKEYEKGWSIL